MADLFAYLSDLPESSLDGIFSSQVVEHLPPERLPEMIRLAASRLGRGGVLAIETPNPECLAIFASHFYLDPDSHAAGSVMRCCRSTWKSPGWGRSKYTRARRPSSRCPALASLPEDFREAFFGGLDYAIVGTKL